MAGTHRRFELKKGHVAIIKQLPFTDASKMMLVLTNNTTSSPFGGNLIEDLKDIVYGFEPTNEQKEEYLNKQKESMGGKDIDESLLEMRTRSSEGVEEELLELYKEVPQAIEILIQQSNVITGKFKTRTYDNFWTKVKV